MATHHGMVSSFTTVPESHMMFSGEVHAKRARTEDIPTGHSQPNFSTVSTEMRKTVTTSTQHHQQRNFVSTTTREGKTIGRTFHSRHSSKRPDATGEEASVRG